MNKDNRIEFLEKLGHNSRTVLRILEDKTKKTEVAKENNEKGETEIGEK